jgi:putative NADH-flavin reductase
MKLTVFGASGRTGRPLVEQALAAGHEVTAFVRTPSKFPIKHERLHIVQGDVVDPAKVEEAVAGADAVLIALGHTPSSSNDVQAVATRNIINAMRKHGVRRLISLTGAGVRDPLDQPKVVDKVFGLLLKRLQPDVLQDAENHAKLIQRSDLDWVIVRGPRLVEGSHTGKYRVGYVGKNSGIRISRADVADFMLKQLTDDTYLRKAPMISN